MFQNRKQAGQLLAQRLAQEELVVYPNKTIVLAIMRGGIVLACEVAKHFKTKLDIIIVKKLAAPGKEELAIGAIGESSGSQYLDKKIIKELKISDSYLKKEITNKLAEIKRRELKYRQGKKALFLENKDIVLVDDGTATGATMIAAAREVWNNNPHRVIIALPVAPLDTYESLEREADSVVVLKTPDPFFAVSQFYQEFEQLKDEDVLKYL